jgi:hypothetical protein
MVELRHTIHGSLLSACLEYMHSQTNHCSLTGPTVSSYAVQDKAQVADVDPSVIVDDDSGLVEDNIEACMVCDTFGDESLLLLCDGCNQSCHVFCAGLDAVPTGAWFCYDCQADPQIWVHPPRPQPARRATDNRRGNRGRSHGNRANRTRSNVADNNSTTWARLWRSVASRTDIDLEFPFEDVNREENQRAETEQRELREWQRRFRVAARAAGPGAANRFRGIAPPSQPQPVDPESQEEIKAWNAFEKARILLEDGETRANKKRKSRQSSAEREQAPPQPSRKRTRPRTLRMQDGESAPESRVVTVQEPSRTTTRDSSISAPQAIPARADGSAGPTFLQSLLDEVDHVAVNRDGLYYDVNGEFFPFGTERSASPDCSSPVSGQATPRSMTPPPLRPVSPTLTSLISPIFPPAPEFPLNSKPQPDNLERARSRQRAHLLPRSPATSPTRNDTSAGPSSPTSSASTPKPTSSTTTTHELGLKTKTEVRGLVKTVLKPYYKKNSVTADEYTDICKSICHRLYEQIGTEDKFSNTDQWQHVAKKEVEQAVGKLKAGQVIDVPPHSKPAVAASSNTDAKDASNQGATTAAAALPIRGS